MLAALAHAPPYGGTTLASGEGFSRPPEPVLRPRFRRMRKSNSRYLSPIEDRTAFTVRRFCSRCHVLSLRRTAPHRFAEPGLISRGSEPLETSVAWLSCFCDRVAPDPDTRRMLSNRCLQLNSRLRVLNIRTCKLPSPPERIAHLPPFGCGKLAMSEPCDPNLE